jgi:hypothetical protein
LGLEGGGIVGFELVAGESARDLSFDFGFSECDDDVVYLL